jgi:dienelactone hydrolase
VLTARSNWLRAMNYYQAAASPYDRNDNNHQIATERMRACAGRYLRYRKPAGEVVLIPWPSGYPLEGYFLPAPAGSKRSPAIICIGEPGQRKEDYLGKLSRYASDRGMSVLAVDLLGEGASSRFDEVVGRPDLEATVGLIMDYLVERDDVDAHRIAILADGWGSSFVARGIAFDDRFAAAVCDAGIWDLHERAFLRDRIAPRDVAMALRPVVSRVARNIKCPVLISAGERGWLTADRVRELYDGLRAEGRDVTLKIFTSEETASAQGHADNTTLANEFIFDWIASRLGVEMH